MPNTNLGLVMTPKIYLILKHDEPYNDNDPIAIAATTFREAAEEVCREKTLHCVRHLSEHGFDDLSDGGEINRNKANEKYSSIVKGLISVGLKTDLSFKRPVSDYSDQQLLKIVEFLGLELFSVKEIDLLV